jgi:polyphosphate kinase
VFRLVALPAPSDREKTQLYGQRFIQQFPAAGEIVVFDRSWYNRAGVEYVMGFCTGIILVKFWLEVGQDEQHRRFEARIEDPLRQWKLSPMDLESYARWYAYSYLQRTRT